MYRASTPTHYFEIPIAKDELADIRLTYVQGNNKVLVKTMADMTYADGIWSIRLTQKETNLFKGGWADAQIRVLTKAGDSFPSDGFRLLVKDVIDDEVMVCAAVT